MLTDKRVTTELERRIEIQRKVRKIVIEQLTKEGDDLVVKYLHNDADILREMVEALEGTTRREEKLREALEAIQDLANSRYEHTKRAYFMTAGNFKELAKIAKQALQQED